MSLAALERRHARDRVTLEALRAIPRTALTPAEQLDYDLFAREYEERIATWRFKPYLYQIDHQGGIQTLSEITELLPFRTVKDYEDWIARLETVDTLVDQYIELLKIAIAEKRTQPRAIMQRLPAQLSLQLVDSPEKSPFHAPFERFPESISAAERERLTAAARTAIARHVLPAYRRFAQFFNDRYLPATRATVGIYDTPEGSVV